MEPIKTLVVGYGLSASAFHLPFIEKDKAFALVGIVQPRGVAARAAYPHLSHYNSLDSALLESTAELVIITTPNALHAPMAKAALEAGRHVVVEKPFALTIEEAQQLTQQARQQNRLLSIYHNRRWDADFLSLQQLLAEGRLGQPLMLVSRFDRWRPAIKPGWKEAPGPGSGIFHDLGPHLIDQALQLFGWPTQVYAHLRRERPEALTTDAFDFFLYYDDKTVQLSAGSLVSAPAPRFKLSGTKGSYIKWGFDPQEALLRKGIPPTASGWGIEPETAWGTLVEIDGDGQSTSQAYPSRPGNYGDYYNQLAAAIMADGKNPVTAEEALQVMQLVALGYQSHEEGRRIQAR
ncbi:MAG: oxidoreductase [Bacteroidetes bacterium]|nr:oxidoreductase [Bacteroidota bacterium]